MNGEVVYGPFALHCCVVKIYFFSVSGVYSAARDLKLEWVVVKAISGYADGTEAAENWKTFGSVMAASVVVNILNDCSIFEDWPHYQGTCNSYHC